MTGISVNRAWRGAIPGIATAASLVLRQDGTAVIAMLREDQIIPVNTGRVLIADKDAWEITGRADSQRGTLAYTAKRIDNG